MSAGVPPDFNFQGTGIWPIGQILPALFFLPHPIFGRHFVSVFVQTYIHFHPLGGI